METVKLRVKLHSPSGCLNKVSGWSSDATFAEEFGALPSCKRAQILTVPQNAVKKLHIRQGLFRGSVASQQVKMKSMLLLREETEWLGVTFQRHVSHNISFTEISSLIH